MSDIEYLKVDHLNRQELARIFSKLTVNPATKCWEWNFGLDDHGYGLIYYKGKNERVHRLLYAWVHGPIPRGNRRQVLDHIACDNPLCSNPAHLKLGTPRDNTLRGNATSAINARKVYCKRGHTLPDKQPGAKQRECKACKSAVGKARRFGPDRERIMAKERECAMRRYWRRKAEAS